MVNDSARLTPGKALWDTLVEAFDASGQVVTSNLLWFALTLPLVTAPLALAGLYYCAYKLARGQAAGRDTFFKGVRLYGWAAYRFVLMHLVVIAVLVANFIFYGRMNQQWSTWAQGAAAGLLVLWLVANIFTFPLYMIQSEKKLRTALRNCYVLYVKRPGWCFSLLAFLLLLSAVSTLLGPSWALCSACLVLMLCCRFTLIILAQLGFEPAADTDPK